MGRARSANPGRAHTTEAFVLGRVDYGESDLVVSLFTASLGRGSALARGARRSQRRFGGGLEPFHTLRVRLEEREGRELWTLTEATLATVRHGLVASLASMEAAAHALSWLRRGAPEHAPEPIAWQGITAFFDALDRGVATDHVGVRLAELGLRLLDAFGWRLELERCVRCGRPCAPGKAARVDAARGGLVCRACGGGPLLLRGGERERLIRAAASEPGALEPGDADRAIALLDDAMRAHTGLE